MRVGGQARPWAMTGARTGSNPDDMTSITFHDLGPDKVQVGPP